MVSSKTRSASRHRRIIPALSQWGLWLSATGLLAITGLLLFEIYYRQVNNVSFMGITLHPSAEEHLRLLIVVLLLFPGLAWIQEHGGFPRMGLALGITQEPSAPTRLFGAAMTGITALVLACHLWPLFFQWLHYYSTFTVTRFDAIPGVTFGLALFSCLLLAASSLRQARLAYSQGSRSAMVLVLLFSLGLALALILLPALEVADYLRQMDPVHFFILLMGTMLLCIALGLGVPLAFIVFGYFGLYICGTGWWENETLHLLDNVTHAALQSIQYPYLAIPLLIFAGQLALQSGVMGDVYRLLITWLGRLPGAFAIACGASCASWASYGGESFCQSGSHARTMLKDGRVLGYRPSLTLLPMVLGTMMGRLLFPAVLLIIAALSYSQPILLVYGMGMATIISTAGILSLVTVCLARLFPSPMPRLGKFSLGAKLTALFPPLSMLLIAIGIPWYGVLAGWVTLTEASALASALMFLHVLLSLRMNLDMLRRTMEQTIRLSAITFLTLMGVNLLYGVAWELPLLSCLPDIWAQLLPSLPRAYAFLLVIPLFLFLGIFMDAVPLFLLTLPLSASLDISGPWHGIAFICLLGIFAVAARTPILAGSLIALLKEQIPPSGSKKRPRSVPDILAILGITAVAMGVALLTAWLLLRGSDYVLPVLHDILWQKMFLSY